MSLSTTSPQIEYAMNGSALAFAFAFTMWRAGVDNEIVVVYQEGESDEATLSINTDYTLSAANNDYFSGGTVTLSTGSAYITNGKTLLIKSSVPRSNTAVLNVNGQLSLPALDTLMDRMTRMIQEAETYSSISQTALDESMKAQLANVLVYEGDVLTYDNDILTI